MSLGNDVVDLDHPESRLEGLHPRWTERVFTAAERAAIAASDDPRRLHWALWAAKESAYKALKRRAPGTVFSPRAFAVELSAPAPDGLARGRVVHRDGTTFALEVRAVPAYVHAVCWSEDGAGERLLSDVATTQGDPGVAVRELAATTIGSSLRLVSARLRVEGRPPMARGPLGDLAVSLSHHGRFVAFACSLPAATRDA